MTDEELQELLSNCPILYHMAERGSWSSIQKHGLLSTSALLDLYEVSADQRRNVETMHRVASVRINHEVLGAAVVRDQLPMDGRALVRCLQDELTPSDWYKLLNSRVFFWLSRERLGRMLSASAYADRSHDVLEVDAAGLVEAYRDRITLCRINSGCT